MNNKVNKVLIFLIVGYALLMISGQPASAAAYTWHHFSERYFKTGWFEWGTDIPMERINKNTITNIESHMKKIEYECVAVDKSYEEANENDMVKTCVETLEPYRYLFGEDKYKKALTLMSEKYLSTAKEKQEIEKEVKTLSDQIVVLSEKASAMNTQVASFNAEIEKLKQLTNQNE